MAETVTILGINGRIGQEVAKAFVGAGWNVIGMGRGNRAKLAGVDFIEGSADNIGDIKRATAGADVAVNALNLPYDKWDRGRAEAQLSWVLEALKGTGKTMLFPGNVYNYGAKQHLITPDTPFNPEKDKGRIRVRMEEMLARASVEDNLQVVVIRSADFYAPNAHETNFDLAIMARLKSKILQYPGKLEIGHSWAYLPDLGRAYVKIAEARGDLPQFESFQFRGHYATGHEMIAAIQVVLPERFKVKMVPWWLLRIIGVFVPILRAVIEMKYLWDEPHRLQDKKLEALLGAGFETPFEEAVATTVRSYMPPQDIRLLQKAAA